MHIILSDYFNKCKFELQFNTYIYDQLPLNFYYLRSSRHRVVLARGGSADRWSLWWTTSTDITDPRTKLMSRGTVCLTTERRQHDHTHRKQSVRNRPHKHIRSLDCDSGAYTSGWPLALPYYLSQDSVKDWT